MNSRCQDGARGTGLPNEHKDPALEPQTALGDSKTKIESQSRQFENEANIWEVSVHMKTLLDCRSKSFICVHPTLRWIFSNLSSC